MKHLTESQIRKIIKDAMQKGYELQTKYRENVSEPAYIEYVSDSEKYIDKIVKEI